MLRAGIGEYFVFSSTSSKYVSICRGEVGKDLGDLRGKEGRRVE